VTVVRVSVQAPADGALVPSLGLLIWAPTARRVVPAAGGAPAAIVLPAEFRVPLVAGVADVEVEPTTLEWVWTVMEVFSGVPAKRKYFTVPDVATVDYTDLVEIDPATLSPVTPASPAWVAPFTELDTRLSAGVLTPDPDYPGFYLIGA